MGINLTDNMSRIHDLDMKHQHGIHTADLLNRDEEARRLKLRALSLRDENATLKDKLHHHDGQLRLLKKQNIQLRAQLEDAKLASSGQDVCFKKQISEINSLKAELAALGSAQQDSNKVLKEKFALKRELDRLKPEIEHLQAQQSSYQAVIAEKNSLRHELESLEVELDNERRSKQKARNKQDNAALDELQSRLDEAEQRLATEKKEREKMKKEHDREMAEANGLGERLEERISTLKLKLKNTQAELRETQSELERSRAQLPQARPYGADDRPAKKVLVKSQPSRKRRAAEMSFEDVTIQTPGNDDVTTRRLTKKRGAEHTLLGEKSTFSITPFLNRTKDLSAESLDLASPTTSIAATAEAAAESEEDADPALAVEELQPHKELVKTKVSVTTVPKQPKARGRPRSKALADSSSAKKNMPVAAGTGSKTSFMTLEKVVEEPSPAGQENKSVGKSGKGVELKKTAPIAAIASNAGVGDADGKKKRRKLLGGASKTLFDDEDGEIIQKPQKTQLGPGRKLKAPLGGLTNAFAGKTFSPLKRDRRGVHASFLA